MKAKFIIALIAVVLMAMPVFSQDSGDPDSLYFTITSAPLDVVGGDSLLTLELYVFNDVQDLSGISGGFSWDLPGLVLDSAVFSAEATAAFNFVSVNFTYYKDNIDSSNANRLFQFAGALISGPGLVHSATAKHLATYWFHVATMTFETDVITIDTAQFGGTYFQLTDLSFVSYIPVWKPLGSIMDASDVNPTNSNLPKEFSLNQNYPNPFNPATIIEFAVPVASHVEVSVFNVLGQKVTTLVNEDMPAGNYDVKWDTQKANAASGIYFYRMTADDKVLDTKKMMLLK